MTTAVGLSRLSAPVVPPLVVPPVTGPARVERVWLEREVAGGVRLRGAGLSRELGINQTTATRALRRLRALRGQDPTLGALRSRFAAIQRMTLAELAEVRERARVEQAGVIADGGWWRAAACRGMDLELFFPPEGDPERAARAKRVCAACPVQPECLRAELAVPVGQHPGGIVGGLTQRERVALRVAGGAHDQWGRFLDDGALTRRAHRRAVRVGITRAATELGTSRRTLQRAFAWWGLQVVASRQAQPPRFTGQQAAQAHALACRHGIMAVARRLGAHQATLRAAFARHGLPWPPPSRPRVRLVDPVFYLLNPQVLIPAGLSPERASARVRRQEEFEVLGPRVVYALGEENRPRPQVRAWRVAQRAHQARQAALAARPPLTITPTPAALEAAQPHEPDTSARPSSRAAA
jgi:WhiB family redox-sensing transcriptional regulator